MTGKLLFLAVAIASGGAVSITAQNVADELRADLRKAAGNYYALTLSEQPKDTPPPQGKQPFYINHYGCPSAYYFDRLDFYGDPYPILARADSLDKLTPLGRDVLNKVRVLRADAHNKEGELTEAGKRQTRELARQMTQRLSDMLTDSTYIEARSIVSNECLLTMGEASLEISRAHQPMRQNVSASHRFRSWMNPVDEELDNKRQDSLSLAVYADFTSRLVSNDTTLMAKLFNDPNYVRGADATVLSRQLFDFASCTLNASSDGMSLYDVFSKEELHRHWMRRNAWAYIRYGGCTLNGGKQPYVQRRPLWNMIHTGDSIMTLDTPQIHLRYTQQSVVMSLVCLLELDDYGLQTSHLDSLEALGWADFRIAPFGGSVMMVHYRDGKEDPDPLVRVLLNGREARLPVSTDCAPYYHWQDVKRYYLRKLYAYARERADD